MMPQEIPRRSDQCHKCPIKLAQVNSYYSALQYADNSLQRSDYCPACWEEFKQAPQVNSPVCHWHAKSPQPAATTRSPSSHDEWALELLRQQKASHQEQFILALYLARRRILHFRQELEQNGCLWQLFEVAKSEEILAIPKIELSKIDIAAVQASIANVLP